MLSFKSSVLSLYGRDCRDRLQALEMSSGWFSSTSAREKGGPRKGKAERFGDRTSRAAVSGTNDVPAFNYGVMSGSLDSYKGGMVMYWSTNAIYRASVSMGKQ